MTSGKQLVYETILKHKGHRYADRWLADYAAGTRAVPESASVSYRSPKHQATYHPLYRSQNPNHPPRRQHLNPSPTPTL